jgi:hypothetical protein
MRTKINLKSNQKLLLFFCTVITSLLLFNACKKKDDTGITPFMAKHTGGVGTSYINGKSFTCFHDDYRCCQIVDNVSWSKKVLDSNESKGEAWVVKRGGDTTELHLMDYETNYTDSIHRNWTSTKLVGSQYDETLVPEFVNAVYSAAGLSVKAPKYITVRKGKYDLNISPGTSLNKGSYVMHMVFLIPSLAKDTVVINTPFMTLESKK